MTSDFKIDIAIAHTRLAKKWKNTATTWGELVKRCSKTKRTNENVAEYLKMSREEQSNIKDVGGFVGGYLSGGVRKTDAVMWRSVATLDIDHGTADFWDDFTLNFDFAAMLYSTHKHTPESPRYRLVFPLSRQVRRDEYEPLCRKIASAIGMDMFDDTTYQVARLFYYPSTSKNGEFVFEQQEGPVCDVDEILSTYHNYKDASEWPTSSREGEVIAHSMKKAGEPTEKPGLIGAFCRAYDIEEAIDVFLSDVYEKTAYKGRYTYKKGSVAAGLVCYEDKFAYSNHETDPASKQLCNAFDLCRIHLFGILDEDTKITDITRMPSYLKMQDFAAKDKRVRVLLTKERKIEANNDFDGLIEANGPSAKNLGSEVVQVVDTDWMQNLDYDKKGTLKPTASNIIAILENDADLAGHMWQNLFDNFYYVRGGLPWNRKAKRWNNTDDANLRIFLEENYGITGKDKIKDSFTAVVTRHRKHPIREYLNSLEWDGTPRLDKLIIDYVGAEDNELNRMMTRKHFTAAVARVMEPGTKYDYCLIIAGAEGIGKSTLFNVMGGDWFSDSLVTMEGTKGMEQARSGWIIELPELGSIKRSDVEQVKAYISRQNDTYRPAYGSVTESHPRQCVFCGTTNEAYFLKGDTGNRRFWVMKVDERLRKYTDPRTAISIDRDQLWAEAVQRYKEGEKLYLSAELEVEARKRQSEFNDNTDDPLTGLVQTFVEMKLPPDWQTWDLNRRRAYIKNPDPLDEEGTEERTKVCAVEFLCEMMGRNIGEKEYKYEARKVNKILSDMGLIKSDGLRFSLYGKQRGFIVGSGNKVGGNKVCEIQNLTNEKSI